MKEYIQNLSKNPLILIRWILLVVFFIAGGNLYAQNRPVNATLQITPPYSVYLADYARPGSEQMQVYLLLRDLSEPVYEVQLRLTIEGSGIRLQTNPSYLPPPITLEGGIPLIVSGEPLAPYLDSRNLMFKGISRAEYEQRRALPEGFYQFTVEVLDYRRPDRSLSRPATFMAWFTLNEPPRITAPICGSTLPLMDPTHILFQWMDGGNINPASPFSTEYELTLVEVFPADRNVDDAIRSSIPLLQTITSEPSYLYGLTDAALIPGQKYAFRVRALDTDGRAVFKNDGYSEVCSFTYGEGLLLNPPDGIRVYAENARKALVNWHISIDPDSYRVEYRRKTAQEEEASSWFSIETSDKQVVLRDLEPETTYELRVASLFNNYVSRYSQLQTFSTPEVIVAACGTAFSPNITASSIPLATAIAGQYWQVGDFEMQLREVRGGDGIFSGWGIMHVPYLSMQIPVKFDEVWVDEDYNLVQGEVVALSENLEAFQKRWEEEHPPQPEEDQEVLAQQKTASDSQPDQQTTAQEEVTNIIVEGEIAQLYVNEQGQVIAVDAQGQEAVVAEEAPQEGEALAVEDSQGNKYTVDSEGEVSRESGGNDSNMSNLKQTLIVEVLTEFSQELEGWLNAYGKGPLSKEEVLRLLALPDFVPEDPEMVAGILDYIEQIIEKPVDFTNQLILKGENDETLSRLLNHVVATQSIQSQLEEEQWQTAQNLINQEAVDQGLLNWFTNLPYRERAAKVLKEHLEAQGMYDNVWIDESNKTKILAKLTLSEEASLEQEIDLSTVPENEIFNLLVMTYKVPYWEAYDAELEGWDRVVNWLRIQDDKIERQEGWAVTYANFVADIANAPYGTVYGWATGEHWRTGQELAWWEQALGILDVVPGEALAKAGITALIIKISGKVFDLAKVTIANKNLILTAKSAGLKLLVRTTNEIIIYSSTGKQVGKVINGKLNIKYSGFGEDIVCDPNKTTTLLGKWKDPVGGGTIDIIDSKLFKVGENKGGANVLSFDGSGMSEVQQWAVNSKWLNEAAQRGDVIRMVSDPMNLNNLFKSLDDVPVNSLKTPKDLSEYLSKLNDNDIIENLSFFGREVKLLSEKKYIFEQVSKQFVK